MEGERERGGEREGKREEGGRRRKEEERLDVKPKVHPLRPKTAANRVGICIGGSAVRNASPVGLNSSARTNTMGNWTGVCGGESH